MPACTPLLLRPYTPLQAVAFKLRIPQRKPWQSMAEDVAVAAALAADQQRMMAGVLPAGEEEAQQLITDVQVILARCVGGVVWVAGVGLARDRQQPDRAPHSNACGSGFSGSQPPSFLCLPPLCCVLRLQAEPGD